MRLYKMELYKICHKKHFIMGMAFTVIIMISAFVRQLADEEATVDGITYRGLNAVRINRQITEEFKGAVTDEKVEKIIEKYGFPRKVEVDYGHFMDANFLNEFVLNYLSNGYINWWDDYKTADAVYHIKDTDLGKVMEITGKDVIFEYYRGWSCFMEILPTGMIVGSILILISLSPVFAGEGQSRMLYLLFTAKEGKTKDVYAKIAAFLTVAAAVWAGIIVLDLALCGIIYGLDGLNCYSGMVLSYLFPRDERMIPMNSYVMTAIILSLLGMLSLGAITAYISSCGQSTFHAFSGAATSWVAPIGVMMFTNGFNGIGKIFYVSPMYMVIHFIVEDVYKVRCVIMAASIAITVFCIVCAYKKYNRQY